MDIDGIARGVDREDLLNELTATAKSLRLRAQELRRVQAASDDKDERHQEQVHVVARAFEAAAIQLEQVARLPSEEQSPLPSKGPSPRLATWEDVDD